MAAGIAARFGGLIGEAMHVRPFRSDDASTLAAIFHAAVHEIAALHYSPEQVRAWSPERPAPDRIGAWAADGRLILVAADDDDVPAAFGDLEANGHIDHLYCRPDLAGTGVGAMLYDRLEAAAVERGLKRLFVEASEPARRFFLRAGFVVVRRRDFEVGGVPIHNYHMEKQL